MTLAWILTFLLQVVIIITSTTATTTTLGIGNIDYTLQLYH